MKIKKVKLDSFELKLIIKSLNEMRNILIKELKPTDDVDTILLKYINILEK